MLLNDIMNRRDAQIAGMAFRCRADAALGFEYVDEGSKRVSGYTHEDLVETGLITLPDLIQPAGRDDVRRLIQDGINRKGTFAVPFDIFTKDRTPAEGILVGKGIFSGPLELTALEGYILRMQPAEEEKDGSGWLLPDDLRQRMLDHTGDIIVYIGPEGTVRYSTPSVMRILGYRTDQVTGRAFSTLLMPDEQERFEDVRQRIDTLGGGGSSARFTGMTADGNPVPVLIRLFATGRADRSAILTASPVIEEKSMNSPVSDIYQAACEASPIPLVITRRDDRRIRTVNEAFLHLTGRTDPEEVTGLSLTATGLLDPAGDLSKIESLLDQNLVFEGKEFMIRTPAGSTDIILSARGFTVAGEEAVTWSLVPVPGKKGDRTVPVPESDGEISKSLFQEFRTDIQLIESILKHKGVQPKTEARDVSRQDRSFLYALSSFYQKSPGLPGSDSVPACAYLNALKNNFIEEYADLLQQITVSSHCEGDWSFGSTAGIPVGVIATELLVNSATHAFSPGESGRIELSFTREEDWFIMQVMDSGKGLPDEVIHGQPSSAGLAMVENLAIKLSGTASFSNSGGARVRIIFPDPQSG